MKASMTATEQFELAEAAKKLWLALLPGREVPQDAQFLLWTDLHSPELVSHGINRAARKACVRDRQNIPMPLEDIIKYAASVMNNEARGCRRFESGAKPNLLQKRDAIPDDNIGNRA